MVEEKHTYQAKNNKVDRDSWSSMDWKALELEASSSLLGRPVHGSGI